MQPELKRCDDAAYALVLPPGVLHLGRAHRGEDAKAVVEYLKTL
jgi:hypothetical protein